MYKSSSNFSKWHGTDTPSSLPCPDLRVLRRPYTIYSRCVRQHDDLETISDQLQVHFWFGCAQQSWPPRICRGRCCEEKKVMTDLSKWNDLASGIHALSLIAVHVSRLFTDSGKIYSFTLLSTFTLYALDEHTFMPSQYILPQSSQMAMYFSGNVECYKINDWTRLVDVVHRS